MDAETLKIWGIFYATHVSKDISQPSEKASWISRFLVENAIFRGQMQIQSKRHCVAKKDTTHPIIDNTLEWHTVLPGSHFLRFSYIAGVQLSHVPYSNVCKNLWGSYRERPCSKVTVCKLCYGVSVWNQIIIEIEWELRHGGEREAWSQMQFPTYVISNRDGWSEYCKWGSRWPAGFPFSIVLCEFSTSACAYGPFVCKCTYFWARQFDFLFQHVIIFGMKRKLECFFCFPKWPHSIQPENAAVQREEKTIFFIFSRLSEGLMW